MIDDRGPRFLQSLSILILVALLLGCGGAPAPTPAGTPAAVVELGAEAIAFDRDVLRVPAEAPFTIEFENREQAPHNVSIHGQQPLFVGEVFGGPATRTYSVPPLPAGQYEFICDVHPNMRGALISE